MTARMSRLIIYVRDVALLKAFYQQHFGLSIITEEIENEWVVFDAGGVELALHLVGPAFRTPPSQDHCGPNTKIVFTVPANLEKHRETLAAAGVAVQALKRYDGFAYSMYDGADPEGNIFQVMQLD
ncbi:MULTISPECIES: VOC family protein [Pseudomonas]|uniref:Lactoylglutathione lyase n=1 Tax=Pseudomonas fluorescens TaxID=294 RepID=A0A0N9XF52_PSEFL|nr:MULTISPECIES: VOC family protein [Pseudomonas]ALI10209.1 lactoylglutathione lyase [Pseudomonas fluorescens]POA14536.1 lactoylglutathione lyase [Pseudomonas sp. MPBD7-1]